jgi:hypothetical protein
MEHSSYQQAYQERGTGEDPAKMQSYYGNCKILNMDALPNLKLMPDNEN